MKKAVVGMQNTLLSEAIVQTLESSGSFRAERILSSQTADTMLICKALKADILIMEVLPYGELALNKRLELTRKLREAMPECKMVLICDENINPILADEVKRARQEKRIDAFFYASVTASYLTAALDAL